MTDLTAALLVLTARDTDRGCWLSTAGTDHDGYRRVYLPGNRLAYAHRLVWEWMRGPIPEGLVIDHVCHTTDDTCAGGDTCPHRRCIRPDHLEPVTLSESGKRGRSVTVANAAKTECTAGHPFDLSNTYWRPGGGRMCRACHRRRQRARYKPVEAAKSGGIQSPTDAARGRQVSHPDPAHTIPDPTHQQEGTA